MFYCYFFVLKNSNSVSFSISSVLLKRLLRLLNLAKLSLILLITASIICVSDLASATKCANPISPNPKMRFYTYHYHRYKFFLYLLLFAPFCCKVPWNIQPYCLPQTQQFYLANENKNSIPAPYNPFFYTSMNLVHLYHIW